MKIRCTVAIAILLSSLSSLAQKESSWNFAVSGDSRNCGDVIMPAIAAGVKKDNAQFYWHLGDYRAIFAVDEDIQHRLVGAHPASLPDYQQMAWQDAIRNQIAPFAGTPFYSGIGNHETIPPKSRREFIEAFLRWLAAPNVQALRRQDNPGDSSVRTWYRWREHGIEFINLDNAGNEQFEPAQLQWLDKVLAADKQDPAILAVVVGMHAALPNSLAAGHSMNDSPVGQTTGIRVYNALLDFHTQSKKNVYILASHSHFLMKGVYDSDYWKSHGGVLPGWIIGTAGAHRYALPEDAHKAADARTNVYGYLLATAKDDGTIDFKFKEIKESEIPREISEQYGKTLVHQCFAGNSDVRH